MNDVEERLRGVLHRLAEEAPEPRGEQTADRAQALHRRQRRTRRSVLAVAAATMVAVAVPVGAQLVGGPDHGQALNPAPAPYTQSLPPGAQATATGGPEHPEVGVAYPFDLYTHCGIGVTRFGGQWWRAVDAQPDPQRLPGADGVTRYTGYVHGEAELITPGLLRFTVDDPSVDVQGRSYDFVPVVMPENQLCD